VKEVTVPGRLKKTISTEEEEEEEGEGIMAIISCSTIWRSTPGDVLPCASPTIPSRSGVVVVGGGRGGEGGGGRRRRMMAARWMRRGRRGRAR